MKTEAEIFAELRRWLGEQFQIRPERVTMSAHLYDDLEFDSLDAIDLIHGAERFMGRKLSPDALMDAETVGDVVNELHALQAKAA